MRGVFHVERRGMRANRPSWAALSDRRSASTFHVEHCPTLPYATATGRRRACRPDPGVIASKATLESHRPEVFSLGNSKEQRLVPRILSISNQKGGVGKTTTAVNLAASLASAERRTLLIDIDPQGNAGSGLGVVRDEVEQSIYDVLIGERTLDEVIRPTEFAYLDLVPASRDLVGAEVELVNASEREFRLRRALRNLDHYEYVLIDCPPSLGLLTLNSLVASDAVLIPLQCEYY